jgi:hypothetical protein
MVTLAISKAAGHVPGLRRVPMLKLLALAEVALLAREHFTKLDPYERRRLITLVRRGRGRGSNLSDTERDQLAALVAKAEPRLFAGSAADKLSPIPLPDLLVRGRAGRSPEARKRAADASKRAQGARRR